MSNRKIKVEDVPRVRDLLRQGRKKTARALFERVLLLRSQDANAQAGLDAL